MKLSEKDWWMIAAAAIIVIVIYNLSSQTAVSTEQTDGSVLADPADPGDTPGGAAGVDLYGLGPNTAKSIFDASGLNND